MSLPSDPAPIEPALLVGIDWGSKQHVVCALEPDGKGRQRLEIPHSAEGFSRLVSWLLGLCSEPSRVAVAIEDPAHPLVDWLLEHQFQVFALNPKQLDRFRDRHSVAGAKDDKKDAFVLADALRTDRHKFTALELPDPAQLAVREASRCFDTLQKDFLRQASRLSALLLRSAPNLLELCPAADEPFFYELLQLAPTAEASRRLRPARVAALLKKHRKRKFSAEEVLAVLRAPRLRLAPGAESAIAATVAALLPGLLVSAEQLRQARQRLDEAVRGAGRVAAIIDSFPGVAEIVTAAFIAEAPRALARPNKQQLRALAGTAPVTVRSGLSTSVRMRRACNSRLRDASFHWARNAIRCDPTAQKHYQELSAKGLPYHRALRSVADRLIARLIAALAADALYQPPPKPKEPIAA